MPFIDEDELIIRKGLFIFANSVHEIYSVDMFLTKLFSIWLLYLFSGEEYG